MVYVRVRRVVRFGRVVLILLLFRLLLLGWLIIVRLGLLVVRLLSLLVGYALIGLRRVVLLLCLLLLIRVLVILTRFVRRVLDKIEDSWLAP